jgi:glycine betaine/proline transport system substrate-binding protein
MRPRPRCCRCPSPITGLAKGDIDVFLGNWMPTMEADIAPYRDAGTVEVCAPT